MQPRLREDAKADLKGLDPSVRVRVIKALRKLAQNPELRGRPLGSRKSGNLSTFRKVSVLNRSIRIVYRIAEDGAADVWVIGWRSDEEVYQTALQRLRQHPHPGVRVLADTFEELRPD